MVHKQRCCLSALVLVDLTNASVTRYKISTKTFYCIVFLIMLHPWLYQPHDGEIFYTLRYVPELLKPTIWLTEDDHSRTNSAALARDAVTGWESPLVRSLHSRKRDAARSKLPYSDTGRLWLIKPLSATRHLSRWLPSSIMRFRLRVMHCLLLLRLESEYLWTRAIVPLLVQGPTAVRGGKYLRCQQDAISHPLMNGGTRCCLDPTNLLVF